MNQDSSNHPPSATTTTWINSRDLAAAMFGGDPDSSHGEWVIRGIKKANVIFAKQGLEPLIFTGRYSTVARVSKWIEDHPDFVASHVNRDAETFAARSLGRSGRALK